MIVYLVTADIYQDDYGAYIDCFGVAESERELELIKNAVIEQGYEPKITELETGIIVQEELGGYAE